jgi:hypothetical protein
MMFYLLQADQKEYTVPAVVVTVLIAVVAWLGKREYSRRTNRKLGTETFFMEVDKFLDMLGRIERAHKQSITDEDTIAALRRQVEECLVGEKSCVALKRAALHFLEEIAPVLRQLPNSRQLSAELKQLQQRLSASLEESA